MNYLKPLIVVIAILVSCASFAQEMPRHVFCAGGGNYESVAGHFSWTIGQAEPMATTYHPDVILSAGFQQYDDFMVSTPEIVQERSIQVYPNPCRNYVYLDVVQAQNVKYHYKLYDYSGRLLVTREFHQKVSEILITIDLSNMAPGLYNLMVAMDDGNAISYKSFKLIRN